MLKISKIISFLPVAKHNIGLQSIVFRNYGRVAFKPSTTELKSLDNIPGPFSLPVIGTLLPYKLGKNI